MLEGHLARTGGVLVYVVCFVVFGVLRTFKCVLLGRGVFVRATVLIFFFCPFCSGDVSAQKTTVCFLFVDVEVLLSSRRRYCRGVIAVVVAN